MYTAQLRLSMNLLPLGRIYTCSPTGILTALLDLSERN